MTTRTRVIALALLAGTTTLPAQPAPFHHYRTLNTAHFRVTVPEGLEREGRVAGAAAERAYALLAKELKTPRGTVDLIVTDDADYSNGYATPNPSNRIVVFATPPVESNSLRLNEDWLQLVITHELTHIFHLDRVSGVWSVAQHLFGRAPALFPNAYGPSWFTEGLAVYYESRFTQGGRLKDAEHRLLARAAAQGGKFPGIGDLSLGSPLFPGGERAYAYGSLLLDYLAATRGDSNVHKVVDAQSGDLIPFRLDHDAREAFGISFTDAFARWRDSIVKDAGRPREPVPGWRQLTTHAYAAKDPRWLNDSTIIYAANDGRSTAAAYALYQDGTRKRVGRRNSLGPNVRMPDGSLLFAQLDFQTPDIVRSDLFVEKDGVQRRLTSGMRLIQPDARSDGHIVSVQIQPARTRLVLLDSLGRLRQVVREAGPDETWSDPRWSPDGARIAVIHRAHGGVFTLESIDLASLASTVLDRGAYLISSPAWTPDGRSVVYTSEATDIPLLGRATLDSGVVYAPRRDNGSTGVFTPEPSPDGKHIAIATLRADGYHIGVVDRTVAEVSPRSPQVAGLDAAVPVDSQSLAAGEYHSYSAWSTVLPTYWYPLIEDSPDNGTRLGATFASHDAVRRHAYDGYAAISSTGKYPTGRLTYRYAGFRKPYVDLQVTQDYTSDGTLLNGGTTNVVGSILRRTQTASLSTTFVRPRVRTFVSFSFGAAIESRDFRTDPPEFLKQLDTSFARSYNFPSAFVSVGFSNLQRPTLSISPEDGLTFSATFRERLRADLPSSRSASVVAATGLYKSLDLPGFAHHVLAVRAAAGWADRNSASTFSVGGVSGNTLEVVPGYSVGPARRTFGVRGFDPGTTFGTRAFAGSAEYRVPLLLPASGLGLLPFFFDRSSITLFTDGGVASCVGNPLVPLVCAPAARLDHAIMSVGAETVLSASVLDYDTVQNIRLGFAVPTLGRGLVRTSGVSVYLAYGLSF